MSPVIQCVMKHLCGIDLCKDQLPNPATAQAIVDAGHYITKTFIADKLEQCENWGLNRDGTSRRKQKILDTSVTLDTGDIVSLGFTRVAQETAKTIQAVTEDHLTELSKMNGNSAYLSETLNKLSFTMSDRASNEKLADKLLDEWRDAMLKDYEGEKTEVLHYHCMAHVLLGLQNNVTPEIKDYEQKLKNERGPLGRDTPSVFNTWSKKETVVGRVVRTTSDTFGPAGDHIGLRYRWEAYRK
ncbi:uncharacterized protein LOC132732770 [Ruditapes philippinarum]|uniref:uncharacterized protein LOC132732770 n=1 Tax=Ruditapes philippinarum TaxID=129788 RepID=UPI00295A9E15|nr:uncharacterized protein LOC132732770 [Ruditapes philippinarum]